MAITSTLPAVEVKLKDIDGLLWEYDEVQPDLEMFHEDDIINLLPTINTDPGTVVKYVKSFADEEFSIIITVGKTFDFDCDALSFEISIDSTKLKTISLLKSLFDDTGEQGWKRVVKAYRKRGSRGVSKLVKFRFANISLEDIAIMADLTEGQDDIAHMGEVLGEVVVRVSRCTSPNEMDRGQLIGTYYFKYRNHDDLIALGIVSRLPTFPRPSNPTPTGSGRSKSEGLAVIEEEDN